MNTGLRPSPIPDEALTQLRAFVERFVHPTEEEYTQLFALAQERQFAPRTYVARPRELCDEVHLVLDGVARHSYTYGGQEHTIEFSRPGDLLTDVVSCFTRKPGQTALVAVTPLRTVSLTYQAVQSLYQASPVWRQCGQLATEAYLLYFRQRALALQLKPAATRYEDLLRTHAELFNQVPLYQLASYLGIAKETLSRLRRRAPNGPNGAKHPPQP